MIQQTKPPIAIRLTDGTEIFASAVTSTDDPKVALIHNPIQLLKFVDEDGTSISGASFMDYSETSIVAIQDSNIQCIVPLNKEFSEFYHKSVAKLHANKTHNFKHNSFVHNSTGTVQ